MNKTIIVQQYLEKNNSVPTRTLSRMLHNEYPELFPKEDTARNTIIKIRNGKVKKLQHLKTTISVKDALRQLQPKTTKTDDYIFQYKKALILGDIHIPYHDLDSLIAAVEYGKANGVDSVYLNGDILDFYQVSRFVKSGKNVTIKEEIEMYFSFIDYIKNELNVPIIFKVGNHEERLERYILANAPDLQYLDEISLKNLLKCDEMGIHFVEGRQKARFGKLLVVHNHEAGDTIFSPVNPARGMFLKYKCSALGGHYHQTSEHFESNLNGELIGCFSVGSLCQLDPAYRPFAYTKWNHGFAIVEIHENGDFNVYNKRIIDKKVY